MTPSLLPENTKLAYCIGAQKAGTTWLYETLRTSSQIHFSRNKELHYFNVIAGKSDQVFDLRMNTAKTLAKELVSERGPKNRRNLRVLSELADLLSTTRMRLNITRLIFPILLGDLAVSL